MIENGKEDGFVKIDATLIINADGELVKIAPKGKFQLIDPEFAPELKESIKDLAKEHGEGPFIIECIKWHPTEPEVITAEDSSGKKFEIKTMYAMVYYGSWGNPK